MEWDYHDAPATRLFIYMSDLPALDEPLPRFLDDPTAAKFMAALAQDPNQRRRLIVELLATPACGSRRHAALEDDAMVRHGQVHRLRIPISKRCTTTACPCSRCWSTSSSTTRRCADARVQDSSSKRDDGRPFDRRTIHRYVATIAKRAGVGHVHPHQLRHLATQSINRGTRSSGHCCLARAPSIDMTLTYAHISDDTVAGAYFKVTGQSELSTTDTRVRHTSVSSTTQSASDHRRLLANGHCTRPALLDCAFESVCERCGFFETGPQFLTILKRQRKHADDRGQNERRRLFEDLIESPTPSECASMEFQQGLRITCITPARWHLWRRQSGAVRACDSALPDKSPRIEDRKSGLESWRGNGAER